MTVAELIKALECMPRNVEVYRYDYESGDAHDMIGVWSPVDLWVDNVTGEERVVLNTSL